VLDLDTEYVIDPVEVLQPQPQLSLRGRTVKGRPCATIVGGKLVFRDGRFVND
jgi:dihydroorotase-like cyclic amidohydrolase